MNAPPVLSRQLALYVFAGLAQLAVDSAVFVATTAVGVPVPAGNLAGRVAAAGLGFWFNGRFTFAAGGEHRLRRGNLARYVVAWLVLTLVSTLAVTQVAALAGLGWSWAAKPFVEAVLALAGFVVQRYWVFARDAGT